MQLVLGVIAHRGRGDGRGRGWACFCLCVGPTREFSRFTGGVSKLLSAILASWAACEQPSGAALLPGSWGPPSQPAVMRAGGGPASRGREGGVGGWAGRRAGQSVQIPGDADDNTRHSLGAMGQGGPPVKPPRTLAERLLCAGGHAVVLYTHALMSPQPCLRGHDQESHGT